MFFISIEKMIIRMTPKAGILVTMVLHLVLTQEGGPELPSTWCRNNVGGQLIRSFYVKETTKVGVDIKKWVTALETIDGQINNFQTHSSAIIKDIKDVELPQQDFLVDNVNEHLKGQLAKIVEAKSKDWLTTCYNSFTSYPGGALGYPLRLDNKALVQEMKRLMTKYKITKQPIAINPQLNGFASSGNGVLVATFDGSNSLSTVKDKPLYVFDSSAEAIGVLPDDDTVKGICVGEVFTYYRSKKGSERVITTLTRAGNNLSKLKEWIKTAKGFLDHLPSVQQVENVLDISLPPALKQTLGLLNSTTAANFWKHLNINELADIKTMSENINALISTFQIGRKSNRMKIKLTPETKDKIKKLIPVPNSVKIGEISGFAAVARTPNNVLEGNLHLDLLDRDNLVSIYRLFPFVDNEEGQVIRDTFLINWGNLTYTSRDTGIISHCSPSQMVMEETCRYSPSIGRDTVCGKSIINQLTHKNCPMRTLEESYVLPSSWCKSSAVSDLYLVQGRDDESAEIRISCGGVDRFQTRDGNAGNLELQGAANCIVRIGRKIVWSPEQQLSGPISQNSSPVQIVDSNDKEELDLSFLLQDPLIASLILGPSILFLIIVGLLVGLCWHNLCRCCWNRAPSRLRRRRAGGDAGAERETVEMGPLNAWARYVLRRRLENEDDRFQEV